MDETTIISAEQPTKFEDDYELNKKDPNAIVYSFVDDTISRISMEDCCSQEEFDALKKWSDEDYHDSHLETHKYERNKVSLLDCDYEVASAEEVIIGREEAAENLRNQRRLIQRYLKILTPVQARRYVLYYGLNMTLKQIAAQEGKAYNAIWESIKWADKKIFEYNCKLSVKMTGNFGSKMDLSEGDNFPRRNLENRIYSVRGTKPA